MDKLEELNIEPIILPKECEKYLVGGHQWVKVGGKTICMYCHLEQEERG